MIIRTIAIILFAVLSSCDKEDDITAPAPPKSFTELLTQKQWILTSYGQDYNKNNLVDGAEETIRDCEKDNTYSYSLTGQGLYLENLLDCGSGITEMPFHWQWVEDGKVLQIGFSEVQILRLTEDELVIFITIPDVNNEPLNFLFIYKH